MKTDWVADAGQLERARRHAALADPHRLGMVEELAASDRSPAWFGAVMGLRSNLVAHHVQILVDAGLVTRTPSEADRRRVYLRLTDEGRDWAARSPVAADRIVFVCTHNSARSQFAEALWRRHSPVPVESGGTAPAERVHPMARRTARAHGVELSSARPSPLPQLSPGHDLVVTVCDSADLSTGAAHVHWSVPDPVADGSPEAFESAWQDIAHRIETLTSAVGTQEEA